MNYDWHDIIDNNKIISDRCSNRFHFLVTMSKRALCCLSDNDGCSHSFPPSLKCTYSNLMMMTIMVFVWHQGWRPFCLFLCFCCFCCFCVCVYMLAFVWHQGWRPFCLFLVFMLFLYLYLCSFLCDIKAGKILSFFGVCVFFVLLCLCLCWFLCDTKAGNFLSFFGVCVFFCSFCLDFCDTKAGNPFSFFCCCFCVHGLCSMTPRLATFLFLVFVMWHQSLFVFFCVVWHQCWRPFCLFCVCFCVEDVFKRHSRTIGWSKSDPEIILNISNFLDTQVSLAPTHVSWLVGPSVTLSDFQSLVSNGRSNQKVKKKQSPSIFEFCFWKDPPHPQKCIWRLKCSKMYMKA